VTGPVPLESILGCLQGVIPSAFATCAPDGTPNVTYMSIVQYVDPDRVALSRQFFNKTRSNLDANPRSQVRVVDPETVREYVLDLEYLHTETQGPVFEQMHANNEAIASAAGMSGVFRLRGVDVHRVVRCAQVAGRDGTPAAAPARDVLTQLDELVRRLSACTGYEEATQAALEALDDLFGFRQSILLAPDRERGRLFAVASNGYPVPAVGAEAPLEVGPAATALATGRVVSLPNLARTRVMQQAIGSDELPLPTLADARSAAAVPLAAGGEIRGVLLLESAHVGAFGAHNERLLRIVGAHLASVLHALDPDAPETAGPDEAVAAPEGRPLRFTHYDADDSVFAGDRYVIKGVAGRILWKLLREHAAAGRDTFTNRELRLDEGLGLPPGNDNLEARLLVLRKRLAAGGFGVELERSGRGRLLLRVGAALELSDVATAGPFRGAGSAG
jgi:adenylate cyclase